MIESSTREGFAFCGREGRMLCAVDASNVSLRGRRCRSRDLLRAVGDIVHDVIM